MPNPRTPRKEPKEPTVSFSVRCPVSMERDARSLAKKLKLERNGFVVAALSEKIARERALIHEERRIAADRRRSAAA